MGLQSSSGDKSRQSAQPKPCGSVIDAQGREVPITEDMIKQACEALEKSRVEKVVPKQQG